MKTPELPSTPEEGMKDQLGELLSQIREELLRREQAGMDTILFIPITGGEGCGKTTLILRVKELLEAAKVPVDQVKMLGGNRGSDVVRAAVLHPDAAQLANDASIHLFQAGMVEAAVVISTTIVGKTTMIFLSDRGPGDGGVYQGLPEGRSFEWSRRLNSSNNNIFLFHSVPVTATVYLSLDPAIGLQRKTRQGEVNRFEEKGLEYHQKVKVGFDQFAADSPQDYWVIDGDQTREEIQLEFLKRIQEYLLQHQAESIAGQPPSLALINSLQAKPQTPERMLRAAKLLATMEGLLVPEADQYLECWKEIAYWLRDCTEIGDPEVEHIRQLLVNSVVMEALVNKMPRQFSTWLNGISELSLTDFKENFWRPMYDFSHYYHTQYSGYYLPPKKVLAENY